MAHHLVITCDACDISAPTYEDTLKDGLRNMLRYYKWQQLTYTTGHMDEEGYPDWDPKNTTELRCPDCALIPVSERKEIVRERRALLACDADRHRAEGGVTATPLID